MSETDDYEAMIDAKILKARAEAFLESDETWDVTLSDLSPRDLLMVRRGLGFVQHEAARADAMDVAERAGEIHEHLVDQIDAYANLHVTLEEFDPPSRKRSFLHRALRAPPEIVGTNPLDSWEPPDHQWFLVLALLAVQGVVAIMNLVRFFSGAGPVDGGVYVKAITGTVTVASLMFVLGWGLAIRRGQRE